jgi:hypothetical protein
VPLPYQIAELTEQVQIASAELDGLKREIDNVARQQQIAHNKRRMVCLHVIFYRVGGQQLSGRRLTHLMR